MQTLLVGYDLNRENGQGRRYEELRDVIKASGTWWHHLDSTWLVRTELSAVQMRDHLAPVLDSSDELLVIDVTNDPAAWKGFSTRGSQWLQNHL